MSLFPAGVEIRQVQANGISFEVATLGRGDRLALCLHGFPEHACAWRHQMPLLAELGYRVWAPNLRGYGNTDSPQEISAYQLPILLADVGGLIQASGARETLLIGHDWGGALAWNLAMRQPELIKLLVICNLPHPACFLRELKRPVQFLRSWYIWLFQLPWLPEALLGRSIGEMFGHLPPEVADCYTANAKRPGGLTAMLNWYRAMVRGGGWRRLTQGRFPKIEIPTLMIWGADDVALDIRATRGTEEYVSNFTLKVLPGVSHSVQQEAPQQVNAILTTWLADQTGKVKRMVAPGEA